MKQAAIVSGILLSMALVSGNIMAEETAVTSDSATSTSTRGGEQLRARTEEQKRLSMQESGKQVQQQARKRYEEGDGDERKEQYKHQRMNQHQTGSANRAGGSGRR